MIQQLGSDLIPALALSFGFVLGVVWLTAATIDSLFKTFCNAKLKDKLVERGASCDEIERIVSAGNKPGYATVQPVPPVKVVS